MGGASAPADASHAIKRALAAGRRRTRIGAIPMNQLTTARELLAYTLWADRKVLKACAELGPEHLELDAGASFGSVLGTLVHVLGAEQVWLSRFVGDPLEALPSVADYPHLEAVEAGFQEVAAGLTSFLAGLTGEQLASELEWTNSRGETHRRSLLQAVLHLVNHSTYHRGQIVTLIRQLGYDPPSTDLVYFWSDRAVH